MGTQADTGIHADITTQPGTYWINAKAEISNARFQMIDTLDISEFLSVQDGRLLPKDPDKRSDWLSTLATAASSGKATLFAVHPPPRAVFVAIVPIAPTGELVIRAPRKQL
ncbi:MAG: hypothetical protein WBD51_05540, partial [Burkholderiaceae bacterium]